MPDIIRPLDRERLRAEFSSARPFPYTCIDGFLDPDFAMKVASQYPTFEQARELGYEFKRVNEQRKVQVNDPNLFPPDVRELNDALASPAFLDALSYITGIPELLADAKLRGGGMHLTGSGGRLDVHVDFNYLEEDTLHRRLNILVYLNRVWESTWGGEIELWDRKVKNRGASLAPVFNRCLIFETSDISFHGVRPLACPPDLARISFAGYYYTTAPPPHWRGVSHSTIFRARPDELLRGTVLMPLANARRSVMKRLRGARQALRRWLPE